MKKNYMFKKGIATLLLIVGVLFIFSLASCSKQEEVSTPAEKKVVVEVNAVELAANTYFADYPGARIVPASKVFEAIDAEEDFLILDIRKVADYDAGHLKGAVSAPWGSAIADALAWLPDDKPVYVNCYSGQTAGQTVAVLNFAGIQAASIKYGWKLGIIKTDGFEAYVDSEAVMSPDSSGVKYDAAVKAAAENYFKAIPESGSNIIAAAKLKEMMDAEEEMTIVSVRKPADYAKGHIEGAINIPFGAGMEKNFSQLPADEKVYVYCYSGQTAGQTVAILRLLGFDAISIKSGMGTAGTGTSGWANENLPLVQ